MKLNNLLLVGIVSSLALTACNQRTNNSGEVQAKENATLGDGIVGGTEVQADDPIKQSIVAVYDAYEGQLCTGSLLPGNLVLTAAHCIGQMDEAMFIFFDTKLTKISVRRQADKIEVSPYWATRKSKDKDTGDVALIHFTGDVPAGYKPATFVSNANKKLLAKGAEVVLAGFGITNGVTGDGAGTLRVTKVKIEDPQFSSSEIKLNQTQGTGACHGDSGGPAYIQVNGKYYLWGVTSRGVDDEKNDCTQYSAYTNALYYKTWLNRMANKLTSSLVKRDLSLTSNDL